MEWNDTSISSLLINNSSDKYALDSFVKNISTGFSNEVIVLKCLNATGVQCNTSIQTLQDDDLRGASKLALDILLLVLLIVTMLFVGCEITWNNIFTHIRRPIGLFIGMLSQFGIMPLSAYCILLISDTKGLYATGVLIISCCPAGTISNTFTYFGDGDLPLSIAMTTASTLIAMGMMPLNLWIYGKQFETEALVIPYFKMALSLITVTSPTVVGMLMRWKLPRAASFTVKIGGYVTVLLIISCIVMEILVFPNMFKDIPWKLYIIIFSMPVIGLTLGYGIAFILKRNKAVRLTIAFECGIQNVPIALTVMTLSFPLDIQEKIVVLPWLYCFAMMSCGFVVCLTYQIHKKYFKKPNDEAAKTDPLLTPVENIEASSRNVIVKKIGGEIDHDDSC